MRQLKYHEQKLLKKVDLLAWKGETNHREVAALRRYLIQDRDDYKKYNRCGCFVLFWRASMLRMSLERGRWSPFFFGGGRGRGNSLCLEELGLPSKRSCSSYMYAFPTSFVQVDWHDNKAHKHLAAIRKGRSYSN